MTMETLWDQEEPRFEVERTTVTTRNRRRLDGIRRRGKGNSPRKIKRALVYRQNKWIWIPGKLQIITPSLMSMLEHSIQPMSQPQGLIFSFRSRYESRVQESV